MHPVPVAIPLKDRQGKDELVEERHSGRIQVLEKIFERSLCLCASLRSPEGSGKEDIPVTSLYKLPKCSY